MNPERPFRELLRARAPWLAVIGAGFAAAYFGAAQLAPRAPTTGFPSTALDAAIPAWPPSVFAYLWAYPGAFLPLFVIASDRGFRRVAAAYAAAIALASACFLAFPVNAVGLRIPPEALDPGEFGAWTLRWIYVTDPPHNLFPSLHVALLALSTFACRRVRPALGPGLLAALVAVAVAVSTTRQHYVVDTIAGVALAFALDRFWLAHALAGTDAHALPAHFLHRYLGLVAGLYVAIGVVFALGLPAPSQ